LKDFQKQKRIKAHKNDGKRSKDLTVWVEGGGKKRGVKAKIGTHGTKRPIADQG